MFPKDTPFRSRRLLYSSRGQCCTLRFPGCRNNVDTTIAAHSNQRKHGGGVGLKQHDIFSVDACSHCHDIYDGRVKSEMVRWQKEDAFNKALAETTLRRLRDGSLKVG